MTRSTPSGPGAVAGRGSCHLRCGVFVWPAVSRPRRPTFSPPQLPPQEHQTTVSLPDLRSLTHSINEIPVPKIRHVLQSVILVERPLLMGFRTPDPAFFDLDRLCSSPIDSCRQSIRLLRPLLLELRSMPTIQKHQTEGIRADRTPTRTNMVRSAISPRR